VFEQYITMSLDYKDYIGKTITINSENEKFPIKVVEFKTYSLPNLGMTRRVVVVKDEVYNKYRAEDNSYRIKGYITENKKDSEELTKELTGILSKQLPGSDGGPVTFSSYYTHYKAGLMFSGIVIFIGAFLGLLFLAATGSIIFFKQLSEANDDKRRYEILRNIGVTNKEIKASISKQIFIVFALPLVIGIMHSLVASTLLSRVTKVNLTLPIIITVSAYTVIYMVYYFLTVSSYYKIINSNR
jgi:putative ABC transport system permease protein